MNNTFLTPSARRVIFQLQLFLGLIGLLLFLIGMGRVALEFLDLVKTFVEESSPALTRPSSLILGACLALVGYWSLYAMAAVGAKEPPALSATRNSLFGIVLVLWITTIWALTVSVSYFVAALVLSLIFTGIAFWLWSQVQQKNLWQVFGERIDRRRGSRAILYMTGGLGLIIMLALGVIFAILSDQIELPVSQPEVGELLYSTTFEDFNDEWKLGGGSQSAEVVEGELVLTEATGDPERGFYSVLQDRKFGDFDLRVRTRQISGADDNSYGVVFRQRDERNYYIFEISGDGYYRLIKVSEGVAESITPWIESEIIHQSAAANEIRITAKGDEMTFAINQQPISLCTRGENREAMVNPLNGECVTNDWQPVYKDNTFSQGFIGVAVGTTRTTDLTQPIVIGFDNLVVIGPQ